MCEIPKIILQTSKDKPPKYVEKYIQTYFPQWEYCHLNDNDAIAYFEANKLQEFPNAIEKYNSFQVGAHATDFLRYYFLYINGGVYLDSDAMIHCNINEIIQSYDGVFIKSNVFQSFTHIFNGFMCIPPKHPIIYDALCHIYHYEHITNYHIFCKELLNILLKNNLNNINIMEESVINNQGVVTSGKKKVLTHYITVSPKHT
mgnify:CR=1 FL=1